MGSSRRAVCTLQPHQYKKAPASMVLWINSPASTSGKRSRSSNPMMDTKPMLNDTAHNCRPGMCLLKRHTAHSTPLTKAISMAPKVIRVGLCMVWLSERAGAGAQD